MDLQELKNFIIQNWKEIASVVLFIISVIVAFVAKRKKGYSFSDIILGLIAEKLPELIKQAEENIGAGNGEQKKVTVLNAVLNLASKSLGRKLSEEEISFIITNATQQIENILGTPQKKEDPKEKKVAKKSKYR